MKLIKTLTAIAFAAALMVGTAVSQEKAKEHKQGDCCAKAAAKKEACAHKCCVESAAKGKECEKCGGKGDIPKKKEEPKK